MSHLPAVIRSLTHRELMAFAKNTDDTHTTTQPHTHTQPPTPTPTHTFAGENFCCILSRAGQCATD